MDPRDACLFLYYVNCVLIDSACHVYVDAIFC